MLNKQATVVQTLPVSNYFILQGVIYGEDVYTLIFLRYMLFKKDICSTTLRFGMVTFRIHEYKCEFVAQNP